MNRHQVRNHLATAVVAVLAASTLVAVVGQAGAVQPTDRGPKRGQAAIDRLGDRLPDVARANGLRAGQLAGLFLEDDTLAVDRFDQLLYVDHRAPGEPAAAASGGSSSTAAPPVTDPVFFLHSRPGADHTIFLDFDGHTATGTTWNSASGISSIVTGPYNTDGDPNGWSASELDTIAQAWEIVAEDFSPWDVNVTTEDPGPDGLRRSGSGDTQWGVRVVITPDDWDNCGCGGFAYIGSFDDPTDEPAYVFNSGLLGVSEASTHEVGHTLGLAHDGLSSGTSYYLGHGSGEASWAPLMGASYYENVTQWSRGEYYDANNDGGSANYGQGADDLAIIASLTNGNGFGYRSDDHGDTTGSSTVLAGTSLVASGVIETTTDVDVFTFDTGAGAVTIDIDPATNRPNLNVRAELRDASGALVATADPTTGLGASFGLTLGAGTYHVVVTGTGAGSPMSSSPTGYTEYASLGQYSLSGTVQPSGGDTTPPTPPAGVGASAATGAVTVTWAVGSEPDLANHTVYRSTTSGSGFTALATVGAATSSHVDTTVSPATTYFYVVTASDSSGNESAFSGEAPATTPAPDTTPPPAPTASSATATASSIDVAWAPVAASDLSSYRVHRSTATGGPYTMLASVGPSTTSYSDGNAANNTTYFYVITAVDSSGNESIVSNEVSAQRSAPDVASADMATTYGTVSGSYTATHEAGGAAQVFTESHSGGKPQNRHDRLEHVWALPVTGGNHVLRVDATATAGGDADGGVFDIAWSTSPSGAWTPVITVSPGNGVQAADLGDVSGTIYLRLTDRDRTAGNNSNDTIAIDHIYLDGGAPPSDLPGEAVAPSPADKSTDVSLAAMLTWTAGSETMSSEVFLGTTGTALQSIGTTMGSSIDPGLLDPQTTYYWRVDATNALGTTTGTVWSFTTVDAPVGPTMVTIDSVTLSTVSAGKGRRHAQATVVVVDDLGAPVGSVQVTGQFSGDINETTSGVTDASGTAVITSVFSARKPTFAFCVMSVSGPLPLDEQSPHRC